MKTELIQPDDHLVLYHFADGDPFEWSVFRLILLSVPPISFKFEWSEDAQVAWVEVEVCPQAGK